MTVGNVIPARRSGCKLAYPVGGGETIRKGYLVAIDSSNTAKEAADATGETVVGIAVPSGDSVDNSAGSDGDLDIEVWSGEVFLGLTYGSAPAIGSVVVVGSAGNVVTTAAAATNDSEVGVCVARDTTAGTCDVYIPTAGMTLALA